MASFSALLLCAALAEAPTTTPDSTSAPPPETGERNATATAAYADALHLVEQKRYDEAIAKLDLASDLEPEWVEPVKLRAEVFAALADKYEPSAAFTAARADELQRLVALEPNVDVQRRKHEIAALQQQSRDAAQVERRHRKLAVPAILVILTSGSLIAAGAMLYGMKPRPALEPGTWRQERRDKAGIALMAMGGILLPPAIVLGVLAGRQSKRDSALRDLNVETDRPRKRTSLAVAPAITRHGGGIGMALRF